ncbi:hypothetical protein EST38_g4608 [Candolleomyces aberdarensis]|uniref:Uncharacterized protein n=1 Tax=Candolleomyces aberdarensis TaxID=2316362 RepID=A0A4Q2DMJ2_9AGAR|nr:hypothetical protein EST38_g4608 [Candolleomyces aberdarensis]
MTLKPGLYQIRYVPAHITPPFLGGVHAVGEDINKPIEALPLFPPFKGVHTWEVTRALDNKDQWVILTPSFRSHSIIHRIGPVRAGWGRPLRKAIQADELDPEAAAEAEVLADKEAEEEGLLPHPDLAVLFTTTIKNWVITQASDGGGDPNKATYTITVPTKLVGAIAAVGVENNHVVTKNYPVIESLHYRTPTWQFVPVNTN